MVEKLLRYTLRIDRRLFQKFRYIAQWEGRSANKEIEQYLKKRVAEFEKEHGKIDLSEQDELIQYRRDADASRLYDSSWAFCSSAAMGQLLS